MAAHWERARRALEARMTDTVRITRAGAKVLDTVTGKYTVPTLTVYEGPARLKLSSSVVRDADAQGQQQTTQDPRLDLPVGANTSIRRGTSADVRVDDVATLIASQNDPANVGVTVRIDGRFFQTDSTARRFPVVMVA